MPISYPNRCAARSRAFAASSSRLRGGALVSSETSSFFETAATSSTARSNAASFAFEGLWKPESLRTNCSDAARISSSVTGGWKLKSVLMLLHMISPGFRQRDARRRRARHDSQRDSFRNAGKNGCVPGRRFAGDLQRVQSLSIDSYIVGNEHIAIANDTH